jgi:phage shock protein C
MHENKLTRDTQNSVFGGVAAGFADFFGIDPFIVRILFILATIFGGGGLILYIFFWIFIPYKKMNVYK